MTGIVKKKIIIAVRDCANCVVCSTVYDKYICSGVIQIRLSITIAE